MIGLGLMGFSLAVSADCPGSQECSFFCAISGGDEKAELPLSSLIEFSAIMVGGLLGNIDELHIYRSGNLMRTEMLDGNYMVTNLDKRDTFVVLPDRCAPR